MNDYEQRRQARIDRLHAAGDKATAEGAARFESGAARLDRIPFGQPIHVGHHSERRDRNYRRKANEAMSKGFALQKEGAELRRRATAAEENTAINSDDPEALTKLRAKLAVEEAEQERDKAANKAKRGTVPGFRLTNRSGNMRRIRERIALLEQTAATPPPAPERYGDVEVSEDRVVGRVLVTFPGRLSKEQHDEMRRNGFVWARSVGAYSRKASAGAWHAAKYALMRLSRSGYPVPDPLAKDVAP